MANWYLIGAIFVPFSVFVLLIIFGWIKDNELNKGEIRRAIAVYFVTAFIVLLSLSLFPSQTGIISFGNVTSSVNITSSGNTTSYQVGSSSGNPLIALFLGVLATIIGLYFGYRSVKGKE